jgi:hypothetical protein
MEILAMSVVSLRRTRWRPWERSVPHDSSVLAVAGHRHAHCVGVADRRSAPDPASASEDAADRLRLALELADTAEHMLRERLRRKDPEAAPAHIEALIDEWYGKRPGAEYGDAEGIGKPWPRDA